MTWQESLRQLDARLAKGEIGAAEYRKSRDEILARASSGSGNSGGQPRTDLWAAARSKAELDEQAALDRDAAETTLVVKMETTPAEEDETTLVVTADQIPAASPIPPIAPAPPTPAGPPGVRPTPYRATPIQGQEVFAEAKSGRGSPVLRFLVPLLVLALVGGGVWWFLLRDDQKTPQAQPPPSSSAQDAHGSPTAEEIAAKLPELPGQANENNGTMTLDRARELELFTPAYGTMLADNGAGEIVYRGAERPGFGYLLVASPIPPANGADGVAVLSRELLQRSGFSPAAEVSPNDPPVITRLDAHFRTFIAVYSSGDVWIQLNVSTHPDGDEQALRAEFQKTLESLTEGLPPV